MTHNKLPKDWEIKTLGEVCVTTSGGTPSRGNKSYYNGTIPWVKSGELNKGVIYDTEEKITEEAIKNSSTKIFPKGTLLIALYGATIGKLAFLGVDAATNQAVCGIYQNENIDSKYLYNFLFNKKQDLVNQGIGGAQPNISQTILKKLEIPLPPLETQQAIVFKIEELFSELDKGIEDLKTAQQQLKTYRQSVLKWAFEGKLTNVDVKDGVLPKVWEWIELGKISSFYNGDRSKKYPNKNEYVNASDGVAFINTGHILPNGKLSLGKMNYISKDKLDSLSGGKIKNGDLVYCLRGATIGKTAIVDQFNDGTVASSLVIIRANEEIYNKYIYYFLISSISKNYIKSFDNGTAQPNLSAKSVTKYLIPNNKFNQQMNIVQEIESRLSVADKMEESIAHSLLQAESLRQSILKKAFSGELV